MCVYLILYASFSAYNFFYFVFIDCMILYFCCCAEAYREYEQTEVNLRGTLSKLPAGAILETTQKNLSSLLALAAE